MEYRGYLNPKEVQITDLGGLHDWSFVSFEKLVLDDKAKPHSVAKK